MLLHALAIYLCTLIMVHNYGLRKASEQFFPYMACQKLAVTLAEQHSSPARGGYILLVLFDFNFPFLEFEVSWELMATMTTVKSFQLILGLTHMARYTLDLAFPSEQMCQDLILFH